MFVPEVPVPGWRLVQPVVVADEELLPGSDGPHRHDAHDVPEPGQQFSLYLCRLLYRVSFYTGTGNIVPRPVTYLTDFFEENKEFSMILGKIWNFKVVFD